MCSHDVINKLTTFIVIIGYLHGLNCIGDTVATSEPLDSNYDESAAKLLQARLFVNGFVCETPVVVDIDRVSTLLQRLKQLEQAAEVPAKALNKASTFQYCFFGFLLR